MEDLNFRSINITKCEWVKVSERKINLIEKLINKYNDFDKDRFDKKIINFF